MDTSISINLILMPRHILRRNFAYNFTTAIYNADSYFRISSKKAVKTNQYMNRYILYFAFSK